jgi:iron complex transport system substrate-binding protein
MRTAWRATLVAALVLATLAARPVAAEAPRRVVSINLCTDQLLLALADPSQIAGLGPYVRDPERSFLAERAAAYPSLSGKAEDVLALHPDLVLAGRFTRRETRELLAAKGLKLMTLAPARSVAETEAHIRTVGDVLGHPERAAAEIARIEAALARARAATAKRPLRVLGVSRRGWISGADSLSASLLSAVGLRNAAGDLGIGTGGFASLEQIVAAKPDLLLMEERTTSAEDQGQAFLLHPALMRLYPPDKRILLPERLITCGGPMLAGAIDRLTAELKRVEGQE